MKNKNLATIHILKNKLGLSEETYRALLQESYQVNSSKDLKGRMSEVSICTGRALILTIPIQQKELKDMMSAVLIRTGCAEVSTSL